MKRLYFLNRTLCAGLLVCSWFTFATASATNTAVKDNMQRKSAASAPANSAKIVGIWELTPKGSYAIVRHAKTREEYKVGFKVDAYDDYKLMPIDLKTGELFDLRYTLGHDDDDLDDELHRYEFHRNGRLYVYEKEDNGRWKRDDDGGSYSFRHGGFTIKIDGDRAKHYQIRFLSDNEFELTQTKFSDRDLRRVAVKKVLRYVRVNRK